MNILLIGDPHFKIDNILESSEFVTKTIKYVEKNKENIKFIVILGDVLDTHEKIHVQPLCNAVNFITELSKLIFTFVLIGNHDRINNNVFLSDSHPFTGLKRTPNVRIIDTTLKYKNFIFVPYVPNGRFIEALEKVEFNPENKDIFIFAHQEFKGCKMGGIISEKGDVWSENYPTVFSGHIHDFQRPQNNIIYVGTPYQQNYHDNGEKGLFLVKIDGEEYDFERINLDIIKKKIFNMDIHKFVSFEPPKNILSKIVLEGDPKIIREILRREEIQNKIKNNNIVYRIKNNTYSEIKKLTNNTRITFSDLITKIRKESDELGNLILDDIINQ